jgi:hypothetical protein
MDSVSMESLLKANEERLRGELRSDAVIDKNRVRSVERLRQALGEALLRYNAESVGDRNRQALADCLTATADEMLSLLLAGTIQEEKSKRKLRVVAVVMLLLAAVCALGAVLLFEAYRLIAAALLGAGAVFIFIAGRTWLEERQTRCTLTLDPDAVWKTMCRTGETMDRKIESFCAQAKAWEEELAAKNAAASGPMDPEELQLFADLLEALYSQSGDFSLRQLKKLRPYLHRRGIEVVEYGPETAASFETLPTKNAGGTLRPALMAGDKLLLPGRAAEHVD